jgi:hypothetical protein
MDGAAMAFELAGLGEQIGADRQRAERPPRRPQLRSAPSTLLLPEIRSSADADEQDVDRGTSATP